MTLPATPRYAFDLEPVAPATEQLRRRSEASMVTLTNGDVLLAYANHTDKSDNDRGHIAGRHLSGGEPVGDERVLVPSPENGLNVMSPALKRLPDGRIGMLFSYRLSTKEASRQFISSKDEGKTWSEPVTVADGNYKTGCHDRFTVHSSGRLLAPLHCTDDWEKFHLHVRVARSDDAGRSWRLGDPLELPRVRWADVELHYESGCIEPGIAERADGSLLMTIRTAMGTQFFSESWDGGETWSEPRSMEVVSPVAPAHLSRLPESDDLLLVWTSDYDAKVRLAGERHTITACVSSDGGRSWPRERRRVLVHDPDHSVDYPSVLYHLGEAWLTLRVSSGPGVVEGLTSTCLMRVPLEWFYGKD